MGSIYANDIDPQSRKDSRSREIERAILSKYLEKIIFLQMKVSKA